MKHTMYYSVGGQEVFVPGDEDQQFQESMAARGLTPERIRSYRVTGADGTSQEVTVPDSERSQFAETMQGRGSSFDEIRDVTLDDGTEKSMTLGEISKYLRSPEYRITQQAADYGSDTWAGTKGAVEGAWEGAKAGAKASAAKVVKAIPEVGIGLTKAVGNALNLGGNYKNAVGNWFKDNAEGVQRWLDEKMPSKTADYLGYEDWSTKAADVAGDVAAMAVKFAPAAMGAPQVMTAIFASDGINAAADSFDNAIAHGANIVEANTAAAASGLINYYGSKLLLKTGGLTEGITNPLLKFGADAAAQGAAMGAMRAGNKGVQNVVEGRPITEGMGNAMLEGAEEGALFHGFNEAGKGMREAVQANRETRQMREARKDNLLTAIGTKEGAQFVDRLLDPERVKEAMKARENGEDVSRKMGARLDLPDGMTVKERNAVVDAIADARQRQAESNRFTPDEVQTQAIKDELASLGVKESSPNFESVWQKAIEGAKSANDFDDPETREQIAMKAVEADAKEAEAAKAPERIEDPSVHARSEDDIKAAFNRDDSIKGQQRRAEERRARAEYEAEEKARAERERAEEEGASTAAEEKAQEEFNQRYERQQIEAQMPTDARESQWPEYKEWLAHHKGRLDSPKSWNKFVMENGLDESLKVDTKDQAAYNEFRTRMETKRAGEEEPVRKPYDYGEKQAAAEEARGGRMTMVRNSTGLTSNERNGEGRARGDIPVDGETKESPSLLPPLTKEKFRGKITKADEPKPAEPAPAPRSEPTAAPEAQKPTTTPPAKEPVKTNPEATSVKPTKPAPRAPEAKPVEPPKPVSRNSLRKMKTENVIKSPDSYDKYLELQDRMGLKLGYNYHSENGQNAKAERDRMDKDGWGDMYRAKMEWAMADKKTRGEPPPSDLEGFKKWLNEHKVDTGKTGKNGFYTGSEDGSVAARTEAAAKRTEKLRSDPRVIEWVQKQAEAQAERKLRRKYVDSELHGDTTHPFTDWVESGSVLNEPPSRMVRNANGKGLHKEYYGDPAAEALNAVLDHVTGKERKRIENLLFGTKGKRTSTGVTGNDVRLESFIRNSKNGEIENGAADYDSVIRRFLDEHAKYEQFREQGGKTSEEIHAREQYEEALAKGAEIDGELVDLDDNPLLSDEEKAGMRGKRFRTNEKGELEEIKEDSFQLESATPEQIAKEKRRVWEKKEIERRQNAPLKGGVGEIGQSLLDLGGAEGGDLFNRPMSPSEYNKGNNDFDFYARAAKRTEALRSDPRVTEWVRKQGRKLVDGKASPDDARAWQRKEAGNATRGLKRVFGDQSVEYHDREYNPELDLPKANPTGSETKSIAPTLLRAKDGTVVGTYDEKTRKVDLYRGADQSTVWHELGGHAVMDWASRNAPELHRKMTDLAKGLKGTAFEKSVKERYPDADETTMAKELVANWIGEEGGKTHAFKDAPEKWYAKAYATVRDLVQTMITRLGGNKVNLKKIEDMAPEEAMRYLMKELASGKQLGEKLGTVDGGKMGAWEKWQNNFFDRNSSLAKKSKEAADAKALQSGEEAAFQKMVYDPKMAEYTKILKDGDITNEEVSQYLRAKGVVVTNARLAAKAEAEGKPVRNDYGGITTEEAMKTIEHYRKHKNFKAIEKAEEFLLNMQDEGLEERVRGNLLSKEEAEGFRKSESFEGRQFHVPLKTAIGENGEWTNTSMAGSEFYTKEGRYSEAGDPVSFMFQEFADAHTRAIENRTRAVLAKAIEADPTLGRIVTDPNVKELRVKGGEGDSHAVKFKTLTEIKEPEMEPATYTAKDGSIKEKRNADGSVMMRQKRDAEGNVVMKGTGKFKSVTYTMLLNGERGRAIANAYTGVDVHHMPHWVNRAMRVWASTATELSIPFAARNLVSDNTDVAMTVLAERGAKEGGRWLRSYAKNQISNAKELFQYAKDGKVKDGGIIDRYIKAGGLIGGMENMGYKDIQEKLSPKGVEESIAKEMKRGKNKALAAWDAYHQIANRINTFSEMSTRLAAFKTNVDAKMSDRDAALWSRRITVDFNRKGNWTPVLNNLFMFSNSVIGSTVRQGEAAYKAMHTKEGRRVLAAFAVAGIGEAVVEALMNQDDKENAKKGKAVGKDMDEYTRSKSGLYLRFGDHVIRTPAHDDPLMKIKYATNLVTRYILGKMGALSTSVDGKTLAKELGSNASNMALRLVGESNGDFNSVNSWMPSVLQPAVGLLENKDYAGREISRPKFDQSRPYSENGRKSTHEIYKMAARGLNKLGGGDEFRSSGLLDISPETIKNVTESLGKNVLRDVQNVVRSVQYLVGGGKDADVRNIPFARDVVRRTDGNDNRFFEALRAYDEDKNEWKKRNDAHNWKPGERHQYAEEHPWVRSNGTKSTYIDHKVNGYTVNGVRIPGINDLRRMENGEKKVGQKWVKHEWTEEQVEKFRERRFKMQADVLQKMKRL